MKRNTSARKKRRRRDPLAGLKRMIRSGSVYTDYAQSFNLVWTNVGQVGQLVLKSRRDRVEELHWLACRLRQLYPLPDSESMAVRSGSILPWAINAYRYWISIEPLFPDDINL